MKFKPLHDRVVVERLDSDEKTAGGIIIPDSAQEKPMQGKILAVGSGARDDSGKIQPLDLVECPKCLNIFEPKDFVSTFLEMKQNNTISTSQISL